MKADQMWLHARCVFCAVSLGAPSVKNICRWIKMFVLFFVCTSTHRFSTVLLFFLAFADWWFRWTKVINKQNVCTQNNYTRYVCVCVCVCVVLYFITIQFMCVIYAWLWQIKQAKSNTKPIDKSETWCPRFGIGCVKLCSQGKWNRYKDKTKDCKPTKQNTTLTHLCKHVQREIVLRTRLFIFDSWMWIKFLHFSHFKCHQKNKKKK